MTDEADLIDKQLTKTLRADDYVGRRPTSGRTGRSNRRPART